MVRGTKAQLWTALLVVVVAAPCDAAGLRDLTPAERDRIDHLARQRPPPSALREAAYFAGDYVTWLISRTTLTPEEERDRARELHRDLLARQRALPVPAAAERLFRKLLAALPPHLKPEAFAYTLTILDSPEEEAFTAGGGLVYVTRPLLDAIQAGKHGEAALAFVLAHELGHVGLQHTRRGWQLVQIGEEIDKGLLTHIPLEKVRTALERGVRRTARGMRFLYAAGQQVEADTFALHLCRNAGIMGDVLDAVRWLAWREPSFPILAADLARSDFESSPAALVRLRHLLMERDGVVEDEGHCGLFAYNPRDRSLRKCRARSVAAGDRPIILVHGLHGDEQTFRAWLRFLAGRDEMAGRPLLVFRYPNNESLSRCGHFLHREMVRVVTAPAEADFIGHSAGGLVIRCYTEVRKGEFHRAVFLGTPHEGSNQTELKFLADVVRLVGSGVAFGRLAPEGRGDVVHDLHPDSLFLRHLGHDPEQAARYHVFTGRCLSRTQVLALRLALDASLSTLRRQVGERLPSPVLREQTLRALERCVLPPEVAHGDLAVSVESATLADAGRVTHTRLHHQAFRTDQRVMRQVVESLLTPVGEERPTWRTPGHP
jgi:pimeloyl-ACP methyl ester carboxylesterase